MELSIFYLLNLLKYTLEYVPVVLACMVPEGDNGTHEVLKMSQSVLLYKQSRLFDEIISCLMEVDFRCGIF